jgi:hypothetical protein
MSIKSRNLLKSQFVAGTAATSSKFEDVFDSHFNKLDDSLLSGPAGVTGVNGLLGPAGATFYNGLIGPDGATAKKGLIGPDGATHYNGLLGPDGATHYTGLWLSPGVTSVSGPTATGATGQVVINGTSMYICISTNNWIRLTGATSF